LIQQETGSKFLNTGRSDDLFIFVVTIPVVFDGKPIIGIVGGIGSGKSWVAKIFGELGCLVIDSDQLVRLAYGDPAIRAVLRKWWGDEVFNTDLSVNRSSIAAKIFDNPVQRELLEQLLHPWVDNERKKLMQKAVDDAQVLAFIWDTPLLVENGLDKQCDVVVFVDAPAAVQLERVQRSRGWDQAELERREKSQLPLDKKREISDYVVVNTAEADRLRGQIREIVSQILE
jgi:dephospho-CoA kinase